MLCDCILLRHLAPLISSVFQESACQTHLYDCEASAIQGHTCANTHIIHAARRESHTQLAEVLQGLHICHLKRTNQAFLSEQVVHGTVAALPRLLS